MDQPFAFFCEGWGSLMAPRLAMTECHYDCVTPNVAHSPRRPDHLSPFAFVHLGVVTKLYSLQHDDHMFHVEHFSNMFHVEQFAEIPVFRHPSS